MKKSMAIIEGGRLLIKTATTKAKKSGGLSTRLKSKVRSGNAHWVTVKEGPLEGRHLLIDGPRPSSGGKSRGKILAGHGIPAHVIEKITGATHAHHLEHKQSSGPKPNEEPKPIPKTENKTRTSKEKPKSKSNHTFKDHEITSSNWNGHEQTISGENEKERKDLTISHHKGGKYAVMPSGAKVGDEKGILHVANTRSEAREWAKDHLRGGKQEERQVPSKTESKTKKKVVVTATKKTKKDANGLKNHSSLAHNKLDEIENRIRHNNHESGHIVTPEGEHLWSQKGGAHHVDVGDAIRKGHAKGNILTHNHPGGSGFSNADIEVLMTHGLKEIRAAGKHYTYRMQSPDGKQYTQSEIKKMLSDYKHLDMKVRNNNWDKIHRGELTPEEASKEHHHDIWSEIAPKYGLIYGREKA